MTYLEAIIMQMICLVMAWIFLFLSVPWLAIGFFILSVVFLAIGHRRRFRDRTS